MRINNKIYKDKHLEQSNFKPFNTPRHYQKDWLHLKIKQCTVKENRQ